MKKISLAFLILLGLCNYANSQNDTIVQDSTGYEFEFYNSTMGFYIEEDTLKSSFLVYSKNRLAWESNEGFEDVAFSNILIKDLDIIAPAFDKIVKKEKVRSYKNKYGSFELKKIEVSYSLGDIVGIVATYDKTEKSPKGKRSGRVIEVKKDLNVDQVTEFQNMLISPAVESLHRKVYNDNLGNESLINVGPGNINLGN